MAQSVDSTRGHGVPIMVCASGRGPLRTEEWTEIGKDVREGVSSAEGEVFGEFHALEDGRRTVRIPWFLTRLICVDRRIIAYADFA